MKKYGTLAILLAFVIITGIVLSGCNGKKTSQDYYPLGVGSYWEYNVLTYLPEGITKMGKEVVKVVGKERVDTLECYIVDRYSIEGKMPSIAQYREYLAKTDEGILCTKRAFPLYFRVKRLFPSLQVDIRHSDNELRFKNKPKEGDSWKWEGIMNLNLSQAEEKVDPKNPKPPKVFQMKGTLNYKYLGKETIHAMNQDFDCIKISLFGKAEGGQEIESTIWYAPGIGRVREEQKFYQGSDVILNLFEICSYNIINRVAFKEN